MELGAGSKGERAAARANELDEVIKVRQESTRERRHFDGRAPCDGQTRSCRGCEGARCGATMPQIERQAASTASRALCCCRADYGSRVPAHQGTLYMTAAGPRVWSSTLATLALDHQWLAPPPPREIGRREGACGHVGQGDDERCERSESKRIALDHTPSTYGSRLAAARVDGTLARWYACHSLPGSRQVGLSGQV